MAIHARPDHVAVAVPDPAVAERFWRDELGGGRVSEFSNERFQGRQLRFANGGKIELLGPADADPSPDNFLRRFLAQFGTRVHHLTLIVPDIVEAIEEVTEAAFDVVDVSLEHEGWKEAFLRPTQVGGLVVQIAQSSHTADEWAEQRGQRPELPGEAAASLRGPHLVHPDLEAAARVWRMLGGQLEDHGDRGGFTARWDDAPIEVLVTRGEEPGPVSLRLEGARERDAQPGIAPPIEQYRP